MGNRFRATFPVQKIRPPILQRSRTPISVSETMAFLILPYDICVSLLSNAESIYILFIVNAMRVVF